MSLERARRLDAQDPLARFAEKFVPIADEGVLAYLDGNSLGRPPTATLAAITELVTRQWGNRMIRSWSEGWLELPSRVGDEVGVAALGAAPGQVIVADSTTVCLYKALRGALELRKGRTEIVTDVHNFPTDRYVVEGIAAERGMTVRWVDSDPAAGVDPRELAAAIGPDTAVVTLSHVAYHSAFLADLAAITAAAHDAGALMVWDLCHSVGAVPVDLDAAGVDFAVGCTYKFLCGGPGAPAFLYVRAAHQDAFAQPIWGWIGRQDPFAMAQGYVPAAGLRRALSGTPPIVSLVGVQQGVALVAEAGIQRIRAKAVQLTEFAIELTDELLVPLGFALASPREAHRRGAHVTIARRDAARLSELLIKAGVIIDFREPDGIRIGLSPLSTGFAELHAAMVRIRDIAAA